MRRTLVGNNIVDHSDVVGASPVGAVPTGTARYSEWSLVRRVIGPKIVHWSEWSIVRQSGSPKGHWSEKWSIGPNGL